MLENLIATLKANPRTIVFTEGPDPRILEAASRLKKDCILTSILIGNVDEVQAAAKENGFDIEGIEIIDPATYPEMDAMLQEADRITDLEERYTAFANIEAWLNEHAYYIPIYQKGGTYEVTTVNNYTKKRASAGIDQFKWKGIVAYDHVITVDENAAFKETWEANRHTFIMDEQ